MEAENQIDSIYDTTAEAKNTKNIITFYFVKHHRYEDIEIKKANLEIKEKNQVIDDYYKDLKRYREDKKNAEWELWKWTLHCDRLTSSIHHTRNNLFYVQIALNKKYTVNRAVMQSTQVTELSKHISGLKHRLQKGRLTFKEEKQLIKQMKELKREKNQVVTIVSNNQERQDEKIICYMKTNKRDNMKTSFSLTEEIDNLRASKRDALKKVKYFEQWLEDIDNKISYVFQKMETTISERDRTKELRHKSKEWADKLVLIVVCNLIQNACDYKNLAVTKDIATLAELSNIELEKFFSQWNDDKTFRNDYNRRVLWSLDIRRLSKDGRIRNPEEKSIVQENIYVREKASSS